MFRNTSDWPNLCSLFACYLTGSAADSEYASAQLVASASRTDHSVVRATVQSEPSGAFILEQCSAPRERTQCRHT